MWGIWSYEAGGLMHVLLSTPPAGVTRLDALRRYVESWGALAPLVYVGAVVVEVVVAPIPGTLLYAPAGAIFGGFAGGALSLIGNVIGAAIACWAAGTFGAGRDSVAHEGSRFARYRERFTRHGAWIVFLLRVNPLTSSDLVSYAAGLSGVRSSQVALGTAFGMAPLCFAQAYLAETLLERLPVWTLVAGTAVLVVVVVALVVRKRS